MKIEIEIDESDISAAAAIAVRSQFRERQYGESQDRIGLAMVKQAAEQYVKTMDFTPLIQAAAKAHIDDVVNKVVAQSLQEVVKKRAKQMVADGSLLT